MQVSGRALIRPASPECGALLLSCFSEEREGVRAYNSTVTTPRYFKQCKLS